MTSKGKGGERTDIATEITERIVAALERGVAPWVMPWTPTLRVPSNAHSGKAYRGVNVLLLWMAAEQAGYGDSRWLTFKQALDLGGHVKKGEKGTRIVFWQFNEREETNEDGAIETRKSAWCRFYTVFNVSQCEGLGLPGVEGPRGEPGVAERVAAQAGARVLYGQSRACFWPDRDVIGMPERERFEAAEAFEATLLHELTHWTGHKSRLAREFGKRFGDQAYAFEELVAELGSAFLCAELGVEGRLQHAEYLGQWAAVLKADRRAIFTAARLAQQASEYLLARGEASEDAEESEDAAA